MAESESKQPAEMVEGDEKKLKYLDFVQVAAIYMEGVQTVEDTVRTVIGPVYDKFYDVPFQLLKFVDHKVDESLRGLDRQVPITSEAGVNPSSSCSL
ncbi:STRESS-RELATED PROTEIN-LIKE [Salix purpurea]|uniref:STRESS-RELATED PROTEIN-LIKE n=1 Tax=Salix purpurea TaxID=77065 RepID=A0A9Q0PEK1_SALPP|nr:STRESS-RELATED PROTEIN-LIKE [Salix purpurea]